jgi:hypothetical protein
LPKTQINTTEAEHHWWHGMSSVCQSGIMPGMAEFNLLISYFPRQYIEHRKFFRGVTEETHQKFQTG